MKVAASPDVHLTYCTNIHPAERWSEVRAALVEHVVAVKKRVAPDRAFGVGLRLSALAAEELEQPAARDDLRRVLADNDFYVFTINGFPYGSFHETRVKEAVYRPDWLERERATYSESLARLLAELLPEGVDGSVSTVPVAYAPRTRGPAGDEHAADALVDHAAFLRRLRESTGRTIGLALEPEPACRLETTADAAAFFEQSLFRRERISRYEALTGLAGSAAEESLRRHLGVCLDTCHAAVEFEEVEHSIERLSTAGIRILKVQLSAGLCVRSVDPAKLAALEPFADDVYLHQVVVRGGSGARSFLDLPEALRAGRRAEDEEWRIHFHVPLFLAALEPFHSTRDVVERTLDRHRERPISSHLEVETYTWDVLPQQHRCGNVDDAVARELDWVRSRLGV
jgi:sugar phosphate isomerase/epimerase